MRAPRSLLASCAGAVLLVACSTGGRVLDVTIEGGDRTLIPGDVTVLSVSVGVSGAASAAVTWSSSDPSTATIDPSGRLEAVAPGSTDVTATSTVASEASDTVVVTVDPPGAVKWTRQFGTNAWDVASSVAIGPDGHVYAAGYTEGELQGSTAGDVDAFVRSYSSQGVHRWTRQFGTTELDLAFGVAVSSDGDVYVAGYTRGELESGHASGGIDAFLRSYDAEGVHRWTRQFGTAATDQANGVAVDAAGNVYVVGYTTGAIEPGQAPAGPDAYVRSYDAVGNHRWTRQFGTDSTDVLYGVATGADRFIYTTGETYGALTGLHAGGSDTFVRVFDGDGAIQWTRQFGSISDDRARGIAAATDGTTYVVGETRGTLEGTHRGGLDAFVRVYDVVGDALWTHQFGTSGDDSGLGVTVDEHGDVFLAGYTDGDLEDANAGSSDAIVRSLDSAGAVRWTHQYGTSAADEARAIASASGGVVLAGRTAATLADAYAGADDAYVRRMGR